MAAVQFRPVATNGLCKPSETPFPKKLSNPLFCPISPPSPFHHHSLTSSTPSSPQICNSSPNESSKCRTTHISAMTSQMEESKDTHSAAALDTPTVVKFTVPPESLAGFEADYERVSKRWPADLATTTDDAKIEQFVTSAHHLARRWLPEELVSRLEHFMFDPSESAALVIRGLPIDKELPPTEKDCYLKKEGKMVSETWLAGIGRIVGQVFTLTYLRGSRGGMGLLVREVYTTEDKVERVSAEGSKELLDFHLDFFMASPEKFPNILVFIGIRGDRNKEGKTLLCGNRRLYKTLDPADIELLRTEKITWDAMGDQFSNHVIEGSEDNPQINLFEENLPGMGGFDKIVKGSPEARAAYKRVKKTAATLAEGVWLDSGDVLILNQKKASHGRSPYAAKYDGLDRWLQRTYVNNGGFWEAGVTQWPSRSLSGRFSVFAPVLDQNSEWNLLSKN